MKVSVDFDQCEATGICAGIAPDVFELDDEDMLRLNQAMAVFLGMAASRPTGRPKTP